jgi:hypothetical protein
VRRLILLSALLSAAVPLAGLAPAAHAGTSSTTTPPACAAATPPSPGTCTFSVTTANVRLVVSSHDLNAASASIWCGTNFGTFVDGQGTNPHSTASKVIAVSGDACELKVSSGNPSTGIASASVAPTV